MAEIEEIITREKTISDGESITEYADFGTNFGESGTIPYVETSSSDLVYFFVDGGDKDTPPATYNLEQEKYSAKLDDWLYFDDAQSTTQRAFRDAVAPTKVRYTLTNNSGSESTYRIEIIALTNTRK